MAQTLFIHSLFRSGSTYVFDKLRQNKKFICFYEPLHQDINRLSRENIDTFWGFIPKVNNYMNHPKLTKAHFKEYEGLFRDDEGTLPYFNKSYSFDEYAEVKSNSFKNYIDSFIHLGDKNNTTALLQFNRTTLRINWFQDKYPNSLNISLLRNPRDQFESYLSRSAHVFEVMNLLIIKSVSQFSALVKKLNIPHYIDNTYEKEYLYYFQVNDRLSLTEKYEIFFTIWLASLEHAVQYSDEIILMDKMNEDLDYKKNIQEMFITTMHANIDFDDFSMKIYPTLSLETSKYDIIENHIIQETRITSETESLYKDIIISRYKNNEQSITTDLKKYKKELTELKDVIKDLTGIPILYSPFKKYKAYKIMLAAYFRLRNLKK